MNLNPKNDGAHAADERMDEVRRTDPPSGGGLTNQQINERIAKLCGANEMVGLKKRGLWYRSGSSGYTSCECEAGRFTRKEAKKHEYLHDEPVTIHEFASRDYAGSLDACREFESKLNGDHRSLYMDMLYLFVNDPGGDFSDSDFDNQWAMFNATPLQRCEAFLRMKGQWE
jgi:hypothetical protein